MTNNCSRCDKPYDDVTIRLIRERSVPRNAYCTPCLYELHYGTRTPTTDQLNVDLLAAA